LLKKSVVPYIDSTEPFKKTDYLCSDFPRKYYRRVIDRSKNGILYSSKDKPKIHIETGATICYAMHISGEIGSISTHGIPISTSIEDHMQKMNQASSELGKLSHILITGLFKTDNPQEIVELISSYFIGVESVYIENTSGFIAIPEEISSSGEKLLITISDKDWGLSVSNIIDNVYPDRKQIEFKYPS
jgi:hypothetical protein